MNNKRPTPSVEVEALLDALTATSSDDMHMHPLGGKPCVTDMNMPCVCAWARSPAKRRGVRVHSAGSLCRRMYSTRRLNRRLPRVKHRF